MATRDLNRKSACEPFTGVRPGSRALRGVPPSLTVGFDARQLGAVVGDDGVRESLVTSHCVENRVEAHGWCVRASRVVVQGLKETRIWMADMVDRRHQLLARRTRSRGDATEHRPGDTPATSRRSPSPPPRAEATGCSGPSEVARLRPRTHEREEPHFPPCAGPSAPPTLG
jgi:hypothetical protein